MTADQEPRADKKRPMITPEQFLADLILTFTAETETRGWDGGPETARAVTTLVRTLVDVALNLPHTNCDDDYYACATIHRNNRFGDNVCDCDRTARALAILRPIANLYGVDPKGSDQ